MGVWVMEFEEVCSGALVTNISRLYGFFHLNRFNSERDLLLVNITNSNRYIIDTTSDVIHSDDISRRLGVFVDGIGEPFT